MLHQPELMAGVDLILEAIARDFEASYSNADIVSVYEDMLYVRFAI